MVGVLLLQKKSGVRSTSTASPLMVIYLESRPDMALLQSSQVWQLSLDLYVSLVFLAGPHCFQKPSYGFVSCSA